MNLLDNKLNQLSKFRTKNWVEINEVSHGTCHTNSQIKFKMLMLKSSLCDYCDPYVSETLTAVVAGADDGA